MKTDNLSAFYGKHGINLHESDSNFVNKHNLRRLILVINSDLTYNFENDSGYLKNYEGTWEIEGSYETGAFVFTYNDKSRHVTQYSEFFIIENGKKHKIAFSGRLIE